MSGAGSSGAKGAHGFRHWWAQRISAIALIPLSIWFAASVIAHAGADRAAIKAWLAAPVPAVLMILAILAGLYHAVLGLEEVIVDYVHGTGARLSGLVLVRLAGIALAAAAVFAVLRIAFVA
ncbi:MAG TPA: succinate dehydrogenase, hydrophobic membrane anchor protein [Alphaproteobacteria bacterium]|jgi:succinate dehydrogenase / fumarate reductase membrane anchor subunit|nr:succinate dehydrogenase, hydrophobic membrane anchor protein [Alphaproteobacteria bacterium]